MELPLVDVNTDTVSQTWPLLLDAVKSAHFIAIDLELSGLGNLLGRGKGQPESRYVDVCETVNSRAILSLGVSCFQWKDGPTTHPLSEDSMSRSSSLHSQSPPLATNPTPHTPRATCIDVTVFNVSLMCQKPYTIDPLSAKFLLKHGFDFNKQVAKGLPYTPGPLNTQQTLERASVSIHNLLATILATGKPVVVHNGWIDLLFLYGNFYAPLPPSLATVTADMSEMFECGVYDTKAIAKFEVAEEATFLEYLFRKCQRDNEALMSRGSPHLQLCVVPLSSSVPTELAPLSPRHTPSLQEVADITLCETFSMWGFCRKADCQHSHDVLMVLLHNEHQLQIKQMKRKRKREQKKASMGESQKNCPPPSKWSDSTVSQEEPGETHLSKDEQVTSSNTGLLLKQFASDLEAARSRLVAASNHSGKSEISATTIDCNSSTTSVPCDSLANGTAVDSPISSVCDGATTLKPSFGHRAGFDAFMTGYVFACYALTRAKGRAGAGNMTFDEAMIAGLSPMKNRLNGNRAVQLILAKSQFVKTSQTHRDNHSKIAEFKKLLIS